MGTFSFLNPDYDGEDFMAYGYDNYGMRLCGERVGCCLSTDKRTNGAVAVFLPGVAQKLSEILDDDFLYCIYKHSRSDDSSEEQVLSRRLGKNPEKRQLKMLPQTKIFWQMKYITMTDAPGKLQNGIKVVSRVTLPVGRVELVPV